MTTDLGARHIVAYSGDKPGMATPGYYATILVDSPAHLCTVQWATREFCRTLGYDEPGIDRAVKLVTELTRTELLPPGRGGKLHLNAVRKGKRLEFAAQIEHERSPVHA